MSSNKKKTKYKNDGYEIGMKEKTKLNYTAVDGLIIFLMRKIWGLQEEKAYFEERLRQVSERIERIEKKNERKNTP